MATNLLLATFGASKASGDGSPGVWFLEVNHRIANNLSLVAGLLQLQAAELDPAQTLSADEAAAFLKEASNRVQLVARLHRVLARCGEHESPDLTEFLREIVEATTALLGDGQTAIIFDEAGACPLPAERALPIGLIVGELVTNCIKYAHPGGAPGRIHVSCQTLGGGDLWITVTDDGVGLPPGFDPATATTLGMRLVHSLSRQVGAALDFDTSDVGLTVNLVAPGQACAREASA